jgi:hypothetical protein
MALMIDGPSSHCLSVSGSKSVAGSELCGALLVDGPEAQSWDSWLWVADPIDHAAPIRIASSALDLVVPIVTELFSLSL